MADKKFACVEGCKTVFAGRVCQSIVGGGERTGKKVPFPPRAFRTQDDRQILFANCSARNRSGARGSENKVQQEVCKQSRGDEKSVKSVVVFDTCELLNKLSSEETCFRFATRESPGDL